MQEAARRHLVNELTEGNRRSAKPHICPRCGADVIRGDEHDEITTTVNVDPEPLTPLDEMIAVLEGLPTFDLVRQTGKNAPPGARCLWTRFDWNAWPRNGTVHRLHHCPERTQ